ncbi:apolipoprotein N-acyltransferase [Sinisalibacter aestuarii]|uniref:Apolipoprotein N-acyltransferase n=1 Tax=Sinisalibacter aestuarii TaxID=2949426 RepID=A0ABQ5LXB2_9RHOB|nr:apolipoprotein N-acyltransferase [Sinisalibacter aestuarii]GKY88916.1 apolipoprotein N-acyltransferase [Sinisalibacter aestuarii]
MPDRGPGWTRLPAWLERRWWRVLAAGLALGVLAALGQAPFGLWPATVLGLAGAYALLGAAPRLRKAALTGWAVGLGYFGLTLVWIVQPFLVDIGRHGWMAPFALIFMAGGMALFWGLGFALARWLAPSGRFGWLGFAAAMGAAEYARGTVFTGFPWGGPGLAWVDTGAAQLAGGVGAFGLSVLTFLGAAALWTALARRHVPGGIAVLAGFAAALVIGGAIGRGAVPDRAGPVILRLVQPNAPQHLKWEPDWIGVFYDRAMALTGEAAEGPAPDLVIWPETAVPTLLGDAPDIQAEIAAAAAPARAIAGIRRLEGRRGYNTLVLFDADGKAGQYYDKHQLVPFGEYMPLGDLLDGFGIHGLAAREGYGYSPGPGAALLTLPEPLGTALPLICYEAIFPADLRAAPGRADWIVQLTNDAWFGTFSGPQQHLAQARFRAIEFGLPFVRAANTGVSAVIDARGHVTAALPLNVAGKLDAPLPGALPPTFYADWGDLPLGAAIVLVLGWFAVARRNPVDPSRRAG